MNSEECVYANDAEGDRFLYCPICLTWPRDGSRCALGDIPSPPPPARRGSKVTTTGGGITGAVDRICAGDKMGKVVEGPGGVMVPGGINEVSAWSAGNASRYCQWVRWSPTDMQPQQVAFSVRTGAKSCASLDQTIALRVNGMKATCGAPRFDKAGNVAGCSSNDGTTYNECLWTIEVPKPGGVGWTGDVCVKDSGGVTPSPRSRRAKPPPPTPPAVPDSPPPPRGVRPSKNPPPVPLAGPNPSPSPSPSPGGSCRLNGESSEANGLGNTGCADQSSCLDLDVSGDECEWRVAPDDGAQYLYCPVCLTWPRPGSPCSLDVSSSIDYICSGDELSKVLDKSGSPVPGGVGLVKSWKSGDSSRYCQMVRWARDDKAPQLVQFSIRSGSTRCQRKNEFALKIRGADATCGNPRTNSFKGSAGCAGNDDIDNECLWNITVPRPGGTGWIGDNCVPGPPDVVAAPPPPRRKAPQSKSAPKLPPFSPDLPPPPPPRGAKPGRRAPNPPPSKAPPDRSVNKIPFPFCACKRRNVKNTPFRLQYKNSTQVPTLSDGKARMRHCFAIDIEKCDAKTACCSMGIKKIEFFAKSECRNSVRLALFNGQSVTWSFTQNDYKSVTYTTFKMPSIAISRSEVKRGTELCMVFTEPCVSLQDFCFGDPGQCRITFFDGSGDDECCPTGDIDTNKPGQETEQIVGAPPVVEFDF
ncbi:hypothetical protein HYH03_004057 [Edaphochlamys debaryana]|uniref:Pherophorin domain-containing protein n=1 Tax=Edaphochlamys debaryana TaxID=47281 RepID=A0A836C2F3_9CHLO|nr:hypothetical protein HYH03_004057 [Edaphochlamys debaryana]|eukprot:KAG2497785.1 hypothetical protein HYH03_004057 [Edaphochlamys debaryana]